jgi:hypothetical protein
VVTSIDSSGVESVYSNQAEVSLTSSPTGVAASASANLISVSWNAVGGASSYIVKRGTTSGGPYSEVGTGLTNLSYSDSSLQNAVTYYYVVDAVFASGAVSPDSSEVSATAIATMNLQVPIELTDQSLASSTAPIVFQRTLTSLDPTAYDGTVTYLFQVVATNADTAPHPVYLVDASGTTVGTITVPASTTVPTRIKASFTPDAALNNYRLSLDGTASAGQLQVVSARMLVTQVGASKTKIYIPLLTSSAAPNSADSGAPIATTSQTTYATPATSSIYVRNTNVFSQLNTYNAWELETVVAASGGATGAVALNDMNQSSIVSDTETLFSNSSVTLTDSPFDEGVTNFAAANQGDQYQIVLSCWSACAAGSVSLYKAGLWVSLSQLSQVEVTYRLSLGQSVASTSNSDMERSLIKLTNFSNPTVYFQSVAAAPPSGTAAIELMDDGTLDSGVAGATAVSGSSLSFSSQNASWMRTGSPLTITSGDRFIINVAPNGGNASVTDAAIVVDAALQ